MACNRLNGFFTPVLSIGGNFRSYFMGFPDLICEILSSGQNFMQANDCNITGFENQLNAVYAVQAIGAGRPHYDASDFDEVEIYRERDSRPPADCNILTSVAFSSDEFNPGDLVDIQLGTCLRRCAIPCQQGF